MAVINFSDFQREIENIGLKNPRLKFDYHSVKIITLPYFNDILVQVLLWFCSCLFLYDASYLFPCLLMFGASCYFLYFNFIGLGICQIDFTAKTITYKNRILILNLLRNMFGFKRKIEFSDIKEISCKEGLLLDRFSNVGTKTRYQLLIETHTLPAVTIIQFKSEEEAENITAILNKFILHKEKIIA